MLGPSSSGTAGMALIGAELYKAAEGTPAKIDVCFHPRHYEGYAGCRSHYAAVGGALGMSPEDDNIRFALDIAKSRNIEVSVSFFEEPLPKEGLTVCISEENTEGKKFSVLGVSLGGGMIKILEVNGKAVADAVNPYNTSFENRKNDIKNSSCCGCKTSISCDPVKEEKKSAQEPLFTTCRQFTELATKYDDIVDLAFDYEKAESGKSFTDLYDKMYNELKVMRRAVQRGFTEKPTGLYGFVRGDEGAKIKEAAEAGELYDELLPRAISKAVATMNVAMSMGTIVAAPTSGSCGILPGCLLTVQEHFDYSDEKIVRAMFIAASIGLVIRYKGVKMSGMEGGCQGEVGVSSAMAAGALVYLKGGSANKVFHAAALALKGLMGLICDPIGANSEIPCVKRNAVGTANAFAAADMALAGIESFIPPDEVIAALVHVQGRTPECFRCGDSGLYSTETAEKARELEAVMDAAVRI